MEDYAYVLDYLPEGRPSSKDYQHESIILALGKDEFKLFELIPKEGKNFLVGDKVYIGKDMDKREKIKHVKNRISWEKLTNAAKSEVPYIVEDIIDDEEERFLEFYNKAHPITKKYHMLELLPGLGKKKMKTIIDDRKKNGDFDSFDELQERVPMVHKPKKMIKDRIIEELKNKDIKYRVWVAE